MTTLAHAQRLWVAERLSDLIYKADNDGYCYRWTEQQGGGRVHESSWPWLVAQAEARLTEEDRKSYAKMFLMAEMDREHGLPYGAEEWQAVFATLPQRVAAMQAVEKGAPHA